MRRLVALALAVAAALLPEVGAGAAPTVTRVAGADRFGTAAALSQRLFPSGAPVVHLVDGLHFPDALAAGPAARRAGGPVLLVRRDDVPAATQAELDRLRPGRVVVVGGAAAVSDAVVARVRGQRVSGADRYGTAAAVAGAFAPGVPVAYVATGEGFADALAGGAAAAAGGGPVLLVNRAGVPAATASVLDRLDPGRIEVLGGTDAVPASVEQALRQYAPTVVRRSGADRYATAAAVSAGAFPGGAATAHLAGGDGFADALAAGAAGAPVLLVRRDCVPPEARAELDRLAPSAAVILGGEAAVSRSVESLGVCPTLQDVRVVATRVGTLSQPLAMALRAGDPNVYIAEKGGRVRRLADGGVVLDLSSQVATGGEQGLLGLAFSPEGRFLYVNYTDRAGDTQVVEYGVGAGGVDLASRRLVLAVDQPFANHNGGHLVFGRDGRLYVGLGDGGSSNDPQDNAQRLDTLLGKILRIDPRGPVPADNPFVGRAGARPEIWVFGLRNPWRFSFDLATGDLWIGDVGQSRREEVDFRPAGSAAGSNFGWARLEGTLPVGGSPPPDAVPPFLEYPTEGDNCAVTGGYVYRGSRIPALQGAYLYGDFCAGHLLVARGAQRRDLGVVVPDLASFGEDGAGEVYVLSLSGGVFRIDPV